MKTSISCVGALGRRRQNEMTKILMSQRKDAARDHITDPTLRKITLILDGKVFRLRDGRKNRSINKAFLNKSWGASKLK